MIEQILQQHNISTDKFTVHSYADLYEELLSPLIDKECTLLEIGVCFGDSIRLWSKLLPKSLVVGIDIENICKHKNSNLERCRLIFADAYQESTIQKVKQIAPDGLDVIIDDGPHTLKSQQQFLQMYLPLLKKGGFAVIEDIQNEVWIPTYLIKCIPDTMTFRIVDLRDQKFRYDDLLLVVKNGE